MTPLLQTTAHTHAPASPIPDQSRAERRTSFDPADFGMPTGREEEWRFTPIDRLRDLLHAGPGGHLAWTQDVPAGVRVEVIDAAAARALGILPPGDVAAALAFARSEGAVLVTITAGTELTEPVRLSLRGTGERVFGHLVVHAERGSRATVVLRHEGTARYSEVVSTILDDAAALTVVSLQLWDDDAVHLAQHDGVVGRDASYRHIAVSLGGQVVRVNTNVRYAGPGGFAELLGVYFADAGQHLEHRSFVDHSAPHCTSDVLYKGALQGDGAHTVWVGDVLIRAAAEGTSTYELNRNLVLTEGARADSVPNLEIETGEIAGAGHASATGRFDDEQLFYLMARGIPQDEARRLVVHGFFADVVGRIRLPDVEADVMTAVEAELARVEGSLTGEGTP